MLPHTERIVLLLVLILVLVAFALLVVALLSGSVLSAWLSVGVSVVAAVVLVIDWLQRRSAVKAGSEPVAEAPRVTSAEPEPVTEVLPVIPPAGPVPAADEPTTAAPFEGGSDVQRTVVMSPVQPSGSGSRPSGADEGVTSSSGSSSQSVTKKPIDRSADSSAVNDVPAGDGTPSAVDRTVSVEAKGSDGDAPKVDIAKKPDAGSSAARPDPDATVASQGDAGRVGARGAGDATVVSRGGSGSAGGPGAGDATVVSRGGPGSAGALGDATVVSRGGSGSAGASGDATVVSRGGPGTTGASDDATVVSRGGSSSTGAPGDATVVSQGGPGTTGASDDATVVSRGGTAPAGVGHQEDDRSAGDGPADGRSTREASGWRGGESTERGPATSTGGPGTPPAAGSAGGVSGGSEFSAVAGSRPDAGPPSDSGERGTGSTAADDAPDRPGAGAAETVVAGAAGAIGSRRGDTPPSGAGRDDRSSGGLFDPVVSGSPPAEEPVGAGPVGEPPEEASDSDAVRIVAGLEDEVVVVDEQPRYHLGACRALTAVEVIPLPVREAVELGFTPCGWCTPDATLASRHRAEARP